MSYLVIYICVVLVIIHVDAMVCVGCRLKFQFWGTVLMACFFPITMPIFFRYASKITRSERNSEDLLAEMEKE